MAPNRYVNKLSSSTCSDLNSPDMIWVELAQNVPFSVERMARACPTIKMQVSVTGSQTSPQNDVR